MYVCTVYVFSYVFSYIRTYLYVHCVVTIVTPPESTTVCRGRDVRLDCGYQSSITLPVNQSNATLSVNQSDPTLPVTWVINGDLDISDTSLNSSKYQLNNLDDPLYYSLTLLKADHTTTYQCIVENTTSTLATVTVIGMYVFCLCMYVHT